MKKTKAKNNQPITQKDKRAQLKSSFRDPAGYIYKGEKGVLLRNITPKGVPGFSQATESGLYASLVERRLLVGHSIIEKDTDQITIKPEEIQTISYPFEWSFSMLKDAALTTLQIQRISMEHGMTLKDASAYNIQFQSGSPIFIDTLSFAQYKPGEPWVAYGQFCRHFLAPLALMAHVDIRLSQLSREYIDGIPLDLTAKMLPTRTKFRPSLLMHLHIHSKAQSRKASEHKKNQSNVGKTNLLAIIDSLERSIKGLTPKISKTEWADYYNNTNYTSSATKKKSELVELLGKKVSNLQSVIDLGGNDGTYSRIFSDKGVYTICADIDPFAVEHNYRRTVENHEKRLMPLVVDITNPGGGLGWANSERDTIVERFQSDLVVALALIHHLAISHNLPFDMIADYFSRFGKYLIIEFVPMGDSQVQKLLSTRIDIFDEYSQDHFEKVFSEYFELVESKSIPGTKRVLYLYMRRR